MRMQDVNYSTLSRLSQMKLMQYDVRSQRSDCPVTKFELMLLEGVLSFPLR